MTFLVRLEVVLLGVLLSTEVALEVPSLWRRWLVVPLEMLHQVTFLSVGFTTNLALVRLDTFVHPDVVEDAPGPGELFGTTAISTDVDGGDASFVVVPLLDIALEIFETVDVFKCLSVGRGTSSNMICRHFVFFWRLRVFFDVDSNIFRLNTTWLSMHWL
eukprot:CAMPEP_0196997656 /NCGR_PEP_ID=MMETSP1380-20130617/3206_1 /TAXON_ID=5936 /ORGANISM="Euplotes crassus, Strain CT5" /LENGTH=159 /DNA_ID=CAMNT_0042413947 /DNA_START=203 /DNA_END=682 /DNA_ORIENTATION=+